MSEATASPAGPERSPREQRYRRNRLIASGVLCAAVVAGLVWGLLPGDEAAPQPPRIDLADAYPPVAELIEQARRRVLTDQQSGEAWGRLGMVLLAHRYNSEALLCFREAERLDPREYRWPFYRGRILELTDRRAAVAAFRRAVERAGKVPPLRLVLGGLLLELGRDESAEAEFRRVIAVDPDNPQALLSMARLFRQRGEDQAALHWARRAVVADATFADARKLLVRIYHARGEDRKADEHLAATGDQRRGLIRDSERIPDGRTPLDDEIDALRRDPITQAVLARSLLGNGRHREAIDLLQHLVENAPQQEEVHSLLGEALIRTGRLPEAVQVLDRAVRIHPGSAKVHRQRGLLSLMQNDWRTAARYFREAVRLKPDFALALVNLGEAALRLGDDQTAIGAFQDAARAEPAYAEPRLYLGLIAWRTGRLEEALAQLATVGRLAPDDPLPRVILRMMLGQPLFDVAP